jgi:hypothetical protein
MKNKKTFARVFVYGLLLFVILNVVLFVLSIIFGFETNIPQNAGIVAGIVMAIITTVFVLLRKPKSIKDVLYYSGAWTAIVFVLLLLITIPNKTTAVVFGNWIGYYVMALMIFVPVLGWVMFGRNSGNN